MNTGLTATVKQFADQVGEALVSSAAGTTLSNQSLRRDVLTEAFNICAAVADADSRHNEDELWAIIVAFAPHDIVPANATPADLRRNELVSGRRSWLKTPSDMFLTLSQVDEKRGTQVSRIYYEQATKLAHTVVSIDNFPSEDELKAVANFQRLLLASLPSPKAAQSTASSGQNDDAETTKPEREPLPKEPLEDVLAELDKLIGLDAVKEEVRLLTAMLQVQRLRVERGLPAVDSNKHLVFSGNPGTGKTTVARLLARIYRSLGVVELGHLTETDRSGLVVGFVGQTAPRVAEIFDDADGGVLLVDEAYSLVRGGNKDFGREAIDAIVKQVEDRRDSMVVILAGYPKEMAQLVSANPGLHSRFPKTITFEDYADDELVAILKLIAEGGHYRISDDAVEAAEAWFGAHDRGRGFGNGRLARNLFEAAMAQHATRLVEIDDPTDVALTTLEAADIAAVPVQNPLTEDSASTPEAENT